ncbi:MAG: hypothetical protein ACKPHU_06060, partial [Planctomycetaceae bacterium]
LRFLPPEERRTVPYSLQAAAGSFDLTRRREDAKRNSEVSDRWSLVEQPQEPASGPLSVARAFQPEHLAGDCDR